MGSPLLKISGFADEIDSDFEKQLETVRNLGMHYISFRSAYGKNSADYTEDEFADKILPLLHKYEIGISSIGSPIGKVKISDRRAVSKQEKQLENLCRIAVRADCRYIRIFSFYLNGQEAALSEKAAVKEALRRFIDIAARYDLILLHENEKDIYGDSLARNLELMERLAGPHFGMAFDFANFVQCGEDPRECWDKLKPYVRYIHIKDAIRASGENVVFGTGDAEAESILRQALLEEEWRGFLTLEPHLVLFDSLKDLEVKEASEVIKENKASSGAEAYAMQYKALTDILKEIGICYG